MTTLWRNFSLNVVANSNWSCLLISAPKAKFIEECNRLPAARRSGRFNKMHGALPALHVSQQFLHKNCPQMFEKEQWPPNNSLDLNGLEISCLGMRRRKLFWKLHPKPRTVSELKVTLEKIWANFTTVHLMKLSRVLQIVWQEYVNGDGKHFKHLSLLICSSICAVLNSWDNFWRLNC